MYLLTDGNSFCVVYSSILANRIAADNPEFQIKDCPFVVTQEQFNQRINLPLFETP